MTVEVEVELNDFDLDEILDEIEARFNYNWTKKQDKQKIISFFKEEILEEDHENSNYSIIDQIKLDFLLNNLQRISINDLENLVK